jgi:hypothetical protein
MTGALGDSVQFGMLQELDIRATAAVLICGAGTA